MILPFSCLPRKCNAEGNDTVYDDGATDPEDLTVATDEVVLNSSSKDNERIEEPEEVVPVYSNPLMRHPAEAGVVRRGQLGRAQRQRNPPGWMATDQLMF